MITSSNGNQYLKPDYLSPLSSTLDAKKSPLALLAQTCSQIGADTSPSSGAPSKIQAQLKEQPKKESSMREKASPSSSSVSSTSSSPKTSFKPYEGLEEKHQQKRKSESSPRSSPKQPPPQLGAPYVYPYWRLKEPCRDPYCAGCHLLKGCPPGCPHCPPDKSGILAAAYAHAQLAALAAASSPQPYVCSWIGPDASYCGKRYPTSEELLAHLRTHTSESFLHRTYPTPPLSPLAPQAGAAARYHPYSKPTLLPPSALGAPPFALAHHPGLPPYLAPYALYGGPRLGASHP